MNSLTLTDLVDIGVFGGFAAFALLDFLRPARVFPKVRFWRLRGLAFFATYLVLSSLLPFVWDGWLGQHRLIDATGLGTFGGAAVGFVAYQLVAYGWHRLMHRSNLLFRWVHQMHHSAERIDIWSAMIFSPIGMAAWTFVGSFALVLVVGVTPEAALLVALSATLLAFLQHSNLKTPRWLGYFVVRPESHLLHHKRGVHAFNYSDLPVIDMIFGTYQNPHEVEGPAGYYDGASDRILAMTLGRDVTRPA